MKFKKEKHYSKYKPVNLNFLNFIQQFLQLFPSTFKIDGQTIKKFSCNSNVTLSVQAQPSLLRLIGLGTGNSLSHSSDGWQYESAANIFKQVPSQVLLSRLSSMSLWLDCNEYLSGLG